MKKRKYFMLVFATIMVAFAMLTSCKKKCNCIYTNPNTGEETVTAIEPDEPCPVYTASPELWHKECP